MSNHTNPFPALLADVRAAQAAVDADPVALAWYEWSATAFTSGDPEPERPTLAGHILLRDLGRAEGYLEGAVKREARRCGETVAAVFASLFEDGDI